MRNLTIGVGIGYDLHRLAPGRKLFLGGLEIKHPRGLVGHSDGDALVHALIDAILGATGEGDIGALFPETDPRYAGIRSTELLRRVMSRLERKKMDILHADCVVVAERPKLGLHFPAMKKVLCPVLKIRRNQLGLKAKTNEGSGLVGRGGAIACWAVALIGRRT